MKEHNIIDQSVITYEDIQRASVQEIVDCMLKGQLSWTTVERALESMHAYHKLDKVGDKLAELELKGVYIK